MKQVCFTVWGDPKGYVARTFKGKHTARAVVYEAWQNKVREAAGLAGLPLPLTATPDNPMIINVFPYFSENDRRRMQDVENVRKGVLDSLFYVFKKDRGFIEKALGNVAFGDRWVGCTMLPLPQFAVKPYTVVQVAFLSYAECLSVMERAEDVLPRP